MSFTKKYNWRVYCPSLSTYAYTVSATAPIVCPIDGSPIDQSLTVIVNNEFENIQSQGAVSLSSTGTEGIQLSSSSTIARRSVRALVKTQPAHAVIPNSNTTLTATQITQGILYANPTANISWTLPNAASIVAELKDVQENDSFDFTIMNGGTKTILLALGGLNPSSMLGNMSIIKDTARKFRLRLRNVASSPVYTIYGL